MKCKHIKSLSDAGWCQAACMYCTHTQESACKQKVNSTTNADRIRSMSDEELAKELTRNPAIPCRMCEHHDGKLDICRAWSSDFTCVAEYAEALTLDWLQQAAKEEHNETD